ncbi:hypothetical protein GW17_00048380 [Ensete ventricosum]|nr:hypothetical protein GW17_00048380 [Ensete ventricosum]
MSVVDHSYLVTLLLLWPTTLSYPFTTLAVLAVCEWILYKSSFHPDVLCYNLLIDAYGQKLQHKKAESVYLQLLEAQCVATEDTYALLLRAYCTCGLLEKCEAVLTEMRRNGTPPGTSLLRRYPFWD